LRIVATVSPLAERSASQIERARRAASARQRKHTRSRRSVQGGQAAFPGAWQPIPRARMIRRTSR